MPNGYWLILKRDSRMRFSDSLVVEMLFSRMGRERNSGSLGFVLGRPPRRAPSHSARDDNLRKLGTGVGEVGLRHTQSQIFLRIHRSVVKTNFIMQMGAGGAAGESN